MYKKNSEQTVLSSVDQSIDVSIVIVSWNTSDILKACLESVNTYTKESTYEIIVVDNGSKDDSVKMIRRGFPNIHIIENKYNYGFPSACNQGMLVGKGRYFLLLNSDTILQEDAISTIVKFMDGDQRIGAAGCMLLNPDGSIQASCAWFPSPYSSFKRMFSLNSRFFFRRGMHFKDPFRSYEDHSRQLDVDWIMGAFILARRDCVQRAGLMDDSMFLYSEEVEWCYRIKKSGMRIVYNPIAKITHLGGASTNFSGMQRCIAIHNSHLYFFVKHFGKVYGSIFRLVTFLTTPPKVLFWCFAYIFFCSKRDFCLERIGWHCGAVKWSIFPHPPSPLRK